MTNIVGVGVPGRDGRLRPLPRSQVRSDPPERLLPPAGVLRARRTSRKWRKATPEEEAAWKAKAAPDPGRDQSGPRADVPAARQERSRVAGQAGTADEADRRAARTSCRRRCPPSIAWSRKDETRRRSHPGARRVHGQGRSRRACDRSAFCCRPGARSCRGHARTRAPNWPSGSRIPRIR